MLRRHDRRRRARRSRHVGRRDRHRLLERYRRYLRAADDALVHDHATTRHLWRVGRGVATKCTFCVERIDFGLAAGLKPGIDPDATPACVNSCIAGAMHFGDADDPHSNISRLLAGNQHFRMHEELGTGPNIHYLWDKAP
jgi:Fe-S-cluster-containing dehydrogenase component